MPRVPEYTPGVELRPSNRAGITVQATPEAFGAGIGRGMQQAAQGLANLGDAAARVKALEDETISRDARNGYFAAADEATYGDGGYTTTAGKGAIDGFTDYNRKIQSIRKEYSSKLTPAQAALFNKAVDVDELSRKRTALLHRGQETKKFVVSTHEAGAANFLTEAVRARADAATSHKYLAAAHAEVASLGELQGLPADAIKLKQEAINDDYYGRVAMDMVQSDPVAAVDYVQKNIKNMTPDAANKLLVQLAKPLGTAAGRDAIATKPAHVPADVASRQTHAMSFFMSHGLTKEQAAGIVGNLTAESKIMPSGAVGDNGTAHGVAQWRGARLTKLKRFAASQGKSWDDLDVQLQFVMVELKDDEPAAYRALLNAKTVDEATAAFIGFERPRGWTVANPRGGHNYSGRLGYAQKAAGMNVKAGDVASGDAPASTVQFSPRTEATIASLPAYLQDQVRDIAGTDVRQHEATQAAEWKRDQTAAVDNYRLRIETADTTLTVPEIMADPVLDDGDRATLIGRYNEKFGDLTKAQANVKLFNAGEFKVDPYSTEGRKAVDGVWGQIAAASADDPSKAVSALPNLVEQTGIVPEKPFNAIRGAVAGRNIGDMVDGLDLAAVLIDADAAAVTRREGGGAIADAVAQYRHYTITMGLSPQEAAAKIIDVRDPEKARERAALMESKPVKDFVKGQAVDGRVRDIFDPGVFGFDPKLGETPAQSAAMVGEYRDTLEESIFDSAGDLDAAKALAADRFRRRYGTSDFTISGPKTVTRLPPEVAYPAGEDGTHDYIRKQVLDALKADGITAKQVYLQADEMTARDFSAGKPPRYEVWYADSDGTLERARLPFYAVPPSRAEVTAAARKRSEAQRDKNRDFQEMEDNWWASGGPLPGAQ